MSTGLLRLATKFLEEFAGRSTEAILTRSAVGLLLVNVVGAVVAFGLQILLARLLGASGFGQYSIVLTWIGILVLVGKLGLDSAALRFLPQYLAIGNWQLLRGFTKSSRDAILLASMAIALLLAAIVYTSRSRMEIGLAEAFYVGAVMLPLNVYLVVRCAQLQAFRQAVLSQSLQAILRPVLLGAIVSVLAVTRADSLSALDAVLANTIAFIVTLVTLAAATRRALPKEFHIGAVQFERGKWGGVAFPMLLITTFNMMLNQVDIIMVGSLLTTKDAGIYAAASRIAALIPFAIIVVNAIAAPMISQLYAERKTEPLQRMITRIAWGSLIVSLPICLIIVFCAQPLLLLFGSEFASGTSALIILGVSRLVIALTGSVGYLLSMSGHHNRAAAILAVSTLVCIALNFALIPIYGINGAALASAISTSIWCFAMVVYARRLLGIDATVLISLRQFRGAVRDSG